MSQYHQQAGAVPQQERLLDEALDNVKQQAFQMKRALDAQNISEALRCASTMARELRRGNLGPKNYYELYMEVTNELRELEMFVDEEDRENERFIVELYETVQHTGNIVPRLYMLITVASSYIKSHRAPAKDVLFDLVELVRGVQHPMRGLFLRNYLSQVSKDKLPDVGSEYEGDGGSVKDAIDFVLQNFGEMTKLWVRMQHQGAVRDRTRREKERRNLRQLVGTNLVRLSEMEGVDLQTYTDVVLPRILEQIVNCKDVIAQEYLMDVVIQVFPDDFHLATLETFLSTCTQLQKKVNVKNIIVALLNRLAHYAEESPSAISSESEMFPLFQTYSSNAIQRNNNKMPLEDILGLQVALVNFASTVYPGRIDYIDMVLAFTVTALEGTGKSKVESSGIRLLRQLLTLPLDSLGLRMLELESYAPLMAYLEYVPRKQVALSIAQKMVEAGEPIDTPEKLGALFEFISPILKDQDDGASSPEDAYEFEHEQDVAARLFHLIQHENTDAQFALYKAARKHYGQGGEHRIKHSLPTLIFGALELATRVHAREQDEEAEEPRFKTRKIFGFVHDTATGLAQEYPELGLRIFLQAAQASDALEYEVISYEFVAKAFITYESDISDSKAQFAAITLIAATLQNMLNFGEENYDTLCTKATLHSAKLLKKPDQCRAVCNCAHLFWPGTNENPGHRDEGKVLDCLQRAIKIANDCMGQQVHLFVEILNKFLYFFERGCPSVTVKYPKGLIALIDDNLESSEISAEAQTHYKNTLDHIRLKQARDDEIGERYREITDE